MKAVIFCIALLVMLVPTAKAISVSPSKYYYGETVTFNFTYTKVSLLPNDEKLKYQVSNETPKLLGTNYLVSGLKIICNNVRIEEPESVEKVKILDTGTPPLEIIILKDQRITNIPSPVISGIPQSIVLNFNKEYDFPPQISGIAVKDSAILKGTDLVLDTTDKRNVTWSFTVAADGAYQIKVNELLYSAYVKTTVPVITKYLPTKYYLGETVDYTFTFSNINEIPNNVVLIYDKSGTAIPFGTCSAEQTVLTCAGVNFNTDQTNLQITNSDNPKVSMIQVTTITGQALSKITPTTIGKDKATVTLTFTKQYDLAPKVQAKSTSVTKDANDCIIEADGMSVKCLFTIDTAGTYSIVYNGIQTTKELVVAGRYVAVSMYMILVLIIL